MKKILGLFIIGAFIAVSFAATSFAGPSRAIIQEMGSTIGAEEVNIDLNVLGATDGAGATVGIAGNTTVGGTAISSVNIGLNENIELRLGALPGLRSYLGLGGLGADASNLGVTVKAGGFAPGLGLWLGYGSASLADTTKGNSAGDKSGTSIRLGAAYTIPSSLVYNVTLGYGSDSATAVGADTKTGVSTLELAGAALYPVRETLLVGVELHYATITVGGGTATGAKDVKATVLVPALGARAIAGNWTIDAIAVLLNESVAIDTSGVETATATIIGVPTLRVNYKF